MQKTIKEYELNPEGLEVFKALSVKQPHADRILTKKKTIEIRSRSCQPQKDILILASSTFDKNHVKTYTNMRMGCALCFVDIVDCKKVSDISEKDWKNTGLHLSDKYSKYKHQYAWFMNNVRPVYPYLAKGQLGIHRAIFEQGNIRLMPTTKELDVKARKLRRKPLYKKIIGWIGFTALILFIIKQCC